MSQNRKRRGAPDEIKENSDSKIPHLNHSPVDEGVFKEIMGELKEIRQEMKNFCKENDAKLEELRMEMKKEKLKQREESLNSKSAELNNSSLIQITLKEITGELKEIRKENKKIKEDNDKKIAELKSEFLQEIEQKMKENKKEILEEIKKIQETIAPEIPIREAILGEWKCVEHENFEGYKKRLPNKLLTQFCRNVNYSMEDGLLKQTGGDYKDMKEGGNDDCTHLMVENNHLKTVCDTDTIDRYIQNGRLHLVHQSNREVWKRIYHKI